MNRYNLQPMAPYYKPLKEGQRWEKTNKGGRIFADEIKILGIDPDNERSQPVWKIFRNDGIVASMLESHIYILYRFKSHE